MEKLSKEKLNFVGIGLSNKDLNNLKTFESVYKVENYSNYVQAYNTLRLKSSKDVIILIKLKFKGINSVEFLKNLVQLISKDSKIIGITDGKHEIKEIYEFKNSLDSIITSSFNEFQLHQIINAVSFNKLKRNKQKVKIKGSISVLKRIFDFLMSLVFLMLLSPILVLVAILIKLDSKGPILYKSNRVGEKYKVFSFYKFRTMKVNADQLLDKLKDNNQYKQETVQVDSDCPECIKRGKCCSELLIVDDKKICSSYYNIYIKDKESCFVKFQNDPRITRLGKFLRNTSIDELPQLINILKGDMSFVGNRPLPLYEAEKLTTDEWVKRFDAPAGLTGLWQVRKRGKKEVSALERKKLDNSYAKNHTFFKDIVLIFKTLPIFIQKENV